MYADDAWRGWAGRASVRQFVLPVDAVLDRALADATAKTAVFLYLPQSLTEREYLCKNLQDPGDNLG